MATVLFLDNTQVFPDDSQSIKLTKENPYFTQSDSYTLDVTLPMAIYENRKFFKDICRIEKSRTAQKMSCRLCVGNKLVLAGSARVTQVTGDDVKVQLLGGNSEVNFLSDEEGAYIDELDLGTVVINGQDYTTEFTVDSGVRCEMSIVYDETEGKPVGTYMFGLIDIAKAIFNAFGFTVVECDIDTTPWNQIFVASAKETLKAAHTLPHWSVRKFIDEFVKFFNVSVVINQEHKTVSIKGDPSFFNIQDRTVIEPLDEFTVEMIEDSNAHALAADNLRYDISDSEHHDYDIIPDDVREEAPRVTYNSLQAAYDAWRVTNPETRDKKIYVSPVGLYTGWNHDYSDIGGPTEALYFTQIDVFGPLTRNSESDNETELKICPVAMAEIDQTQGEGRTLQRFWGHIPSLENPTGNDFRRIGRHMEVLVPEEEEEGATIQEYILGEKEVEKREKEDRMQVMFIDDRNQPWHVWTEQAGEQELQRRIGFTDHLYKKDHGGALHHAWSLSLNKCDAYYYLGQLHNNGFSFDLKAKLCVKFLAEEIPDPTKVFIIRNKRYGCEKIEANIDARGMQELMTGYFYEMKVLEHALVV